MAPPAEPCHSGGGLNKKDGKKPKPFDFGSRALSVGSNVVNDSLFRALLHWLHVYCSKIKKKRQAKPNPKDSWSGTLSVGPNMFNDSLFGSLPHWWCVYGSKIWKRAWPNLTLMTLDREPCQLVPIMIMTLHWEHCHLGGVFMTVKVEKKTGQT